MLLRGKRPPSFRWLNILPLAAQVSGKFIVLNERIHRFHDLRLFIEVLDWKRPLAPALCVLGVVLCLSRDPVIGLGVFLVAFALILGFSDRTS